MHWRSASRLEAMACPLQPFHLGKVNEWSLFTCWGTGFTEQAVKTVELLGTFKGFRSNTLVPPAPSCWEMPRKGVG